MERVEELIIIDPKPREHEVDLHEIGDEGADDDEGDILLGGFPGNPPKQGM